MRFGYPCNGHKSWNHPYETWTALTTTAFRNVKAACLQLYKAFSHVLSCAQVFFMKVKSEFEKGCGKMLIT
jgi:hypothetical protein